MNLLFGTLFLLLRRINGRDKAKDGYFVNSYKERLSPAVFERCEVKEAARQLNIHNSSERATLKLRVEFDHVVGIALEGKQFRIPFGVFEQPHAAFVAALSRPVMVMGKNGYLSLKPSASDLIVRYDGKDASVMASMPLSTFREFVAEVLN